MFSDSYAVLFGFFKQHFSFIAFLSALSVLVLAFVAVIFKFVVPFFNKRKYLKSKIKHSGGRTREHYKRKLRRLYLGLIPFYNLINKRKEK